MSIQQIEVVQQFLRLLGSVIPTQVRLDTLSEDVRYEWFAAQPLPVKRLLVGRADVESYLSILPYIYQILDADETTLYATGNKVVSIGGERARIVRTGQVVRTNWV